MKPLPQILNYLKNHVYIKTQSPKADQHQFPTINRKGYENNAIMANAFIFEQILSTSSMRKCMAISLENLYVIIGLKVYVCPNVDVFNYISVQGKGQSARSYLPSTHSVVSRSLKSFFFTVS